MEQLLGLQTWGIDLIQAVQTISSSTLDAFFQAITWLGNREGYLVILTLLYWCVDRRAGLRLLLLSMFSSWGNEGLKSWFDLPRPDPALVRQLVSEASFGFPSNHAQTGGVIVWGYLAARLRRGWFTWLAVSMALLIGLSRVYLGIHFPQDVLGGWLIGFIVLLLWLRLEDRAAAWWLRQPVARQVGIAVLLPLLLLLVTPADALNRYPNETGATLAGILMGVLLGSLLERRTVRFRVEGSLGQRALRYLVGIVLVGVLYFGGALLPELHPWLLDSALRSVRYALIGLAATWLAPWVFVKLRLAESSRAE